MPLERKCVYTSRDQITPVPDEAVILLVEDRGNEIILIRKALEKGDIFNPLQVVRDGPEALAYLSGEGRYGNRDEFPLPALVLLDLKMPGMDGFEVLSWIRQQPGLRALRVIVLTSSEAPRDVNEAYRLGANSFLVKPMDFKEFVATTTLIKDYWLRTDRGPETFRPARQRNAADN